MTEDLIKKKINDWREEGINMRSFFHYAIVHIPGYINAYKGISLDTSGRPIPAPMTIVEDPATIKPEPPSTGTGSDSR